MTAMSESRRFLTQAKGLVGLIVIGLIVAFLFGVYQQAFASVTHVTVEGDRVGLQLDKGSSVRAFGVPVGTVRSVRVVGDGTEIDIAIDKDKADLIPADVTASIRATTVFGAKVVELNVPEGEVGDSIQAGARIPTKSDTIEVNDVFAHAMDLLDAVDVEKLNTTLNATATALDGRGEELGKLLSNTDDYLAAINPKLGQLEADLDLTETVAGNYNQVAPEVLRTADQLTTTTDLLASTQADFHQIAGDVAVGTDAAAGFIRSIGVPLTRTVQSLGPVSSLLRTYAPELACALPQLVEHNIRFKPLFDNAAPELYGSISFLPGQEPYTKANLPKFVRGVGPRCYQQQTLAKPVVPHVEFDDGTAGIYDTSMTPEVASPVTLYYDMVQSFFGSSGLNALLAGQKADLAANKNGARR
ncbi:MCE family protein [Nocardioides marmoriginsengisoli]|uniref:MCE family protein n=1 Tax=Nocardioides marmoriginsengisoli TaxID=661483 RepID=A0A3N0CH77_9ACTN|nr:MCE family protein [Nocardioides marmoriginsengisoli]RNL62788.1 MCE family protein [Nocardioides marmoriginsengisoli]